MSGFGFILRTDGTCHELLKEPTLAELQKMVGGWIERVRVAADGELGDLIVNEEGRLYDLPLNREASRLYWTGRATTDPIVGDAVLLLGPWKLK